MPLLMAMILFMLRRGRIPKLWKRDIKRAFRRLGIRADHLKFAYVVWRWLGQLWLAVGIHLASAAVDARLVALLALEHLLMDELRAVQARGHTTAAVQAGACAGREPPPAMCPSTLRQKAWLQ